MYRLTDVQQHLNLPIGTITAHMQHHQVIPQRIASNPQVRSVNEVDRVITTDARHQLAGLLGLPCPGPEGTPVDIDCSISEGIAQRRGFVHSECEATLGALLAVLYSGYPHDPSALDDLPEAVRASAEKAAGLVVE